MTIVRIFLILFIFYSCLNAQVVHEDTKNDIYNFILRNSIGNNENIGDDILPFTRKKIAKSLIQIQNSQLKLSKIDQEDLNYFLYEFSDEILRQKINDYSTDEKLFLLKKEPDNRFRFLSFRSKIFSLNVEPILGYEIKNVFDKGLYHHRWNGLKLFGYIYDSFGFKLSFNDNLEKGVDLISLHKYNPKTGINIIKGSVNTIEYDDVNASISYSWDWGDITFAKDYSEIGYGIDGKIILSNRAPSFPFINLSIAPFKNLRFTYLHGWLHSVLIDSTSIKYTSVKGRESYDHREKFIAMHLVSFEPLRNLNISVGESIIYSDKVEPIYLIPIMFFRLADHYMMKDDSNSGDNAQIFGNISFTIPILKMRLYSSIFIDELSVTGLLEGGDYFSAVAYTFGSQFVDPIIKNSIVSFEYTRVNPFVYMNSNDAQTFRSHNYQLGHWIGSNADCFQFQYIQKIIRPLKFELLGRYVRRGQTELPEQQYQLPTIKFLEGLNARYLEAGIEVQYQLLPELFFRLNYLFSKISEEDNSRTPANLTRAKHTLGFSISYGI